MIREPIARCSCPMVCKLFRTLTFCAPSRLDFAKRREIEPAQRHPIPNAARSRGTPVHRARRRARSGDRGAPFLSAQDFIALDRRNPDLFPLSVRPATLEGHPRRLDLEPAFKFVAACILQLIFGMCSPLIGPMTPKTCSTQIKTTTNTTTFSRLLIAPAIGI